jgi:hypothetical protein
MGKRLMKTFKSIRIVMMSLIALIVFSFASRAVAAVDAFMIFTASDGKITKVKIEPNGSFNTPSLHKGVYSWSFGVSQSSGDNRPTESLSLNFTKIVVAYAQIAWNGAAYGEHRHLPVTIRKEIDKSSPSFSKALGTVEVDVDRDSISGTVAAFDKSGSAVGRANWDLTTNTK